MSTWEPETVINCNYSHSILYDTLYFLLTQKQQSLMWLTTVIHWLQYVPSYICIIVAVCTSPAYWRYMHNRCGILSRPNYYKFQDPFFSFFFVFSPHPSFFASLTMPLPIRRLGNWRFCQAISYFFLQSDRFFFLGQLKPFGLTIAADCCPKRVYTSTWYIYTQSCDGRWWYGGLFGLATLFVRRIWGTMRDQEKQSWRSASTTIPKGNTSFVLCVLVGYVAFFV